jgi:hypothetical protein
MTFSRRGPTAAIVAAGLALIATHSVAHPSPRAKKQPAGRYRPHVVVATLDTGTNPFHPTWRRSQHRHPSTFIPGYPSWAEAVELTFAGSFDASVEASQQELEKFKDGKFPYWIPGTNLIGTWAADPDQIRIFDPAARENLGSATHDHGARASSQIAGLGFGMSPDAYLVIMDRTPDRSTTSGFGPYEGNAEGLRWAADQPWIDIIHTNIQNVVPLANNQTPSFRGYPEALQYALSKGKIVVTAGGNFYVEPTETSPHGGPPGTLVAGANDNCGYTDFSNPDPHVVMDGNGTRAAQANGFDDEAFGGTSSASPRITGYIAELLLRIRRHFDYRGGIRDGALVLLDDKAALPNEGPMKDGRLVAAELHEIVRKTADPNSHPSEWDGAQTLNCVPQPVDLPFAFYPKMGYGEISEHTIDAAFGVAIGGQPMPERPVEDAYYEQSEELRALFWD